MRRDKELLRKILLLVEEEGNPNIYEVPTFEGYTGDQVKYHIIMLKDNNFLKGAISYGDGRIAELSLELTYDAHDALDAMREKVTWNKFKEWMLATGSALTIATAKQFMLKHLEGKTEFEIESLCCVINYSKKGDIDNGTKFRCKKFIRNL